MTTLSAKKLVAAIALAMGLFGAPVERVEAHFSNDDHQGDIISTQVDAHYDSDLDQYIPKLTVKWSLSGLPSTVTYHRRSIYTITVRVSSPGPRSTSRSQRIDPHQDATGTFVFNERLQWNVTSTVTLNLTNHSSNPRDLDDRSTYCGGTSCTQRLKTKYVDIGSPQEPETPTEPETPEPETPTEPETPGSTSQTCTYEHRLIGIPGSTAGGYTGQILISSKDSNATARIRAYQSDNGHPIDVLDSEGSAIGSRVSLSPAHSVKTFRLEGARGWHSAIVEHPSARAMRRATVVMRLREPDVGVSFMPADRIEDCETAGTNME